MWELIGYDLINGGKTSHKTVDKVIFINHEEMEEFREKMMIENPDHEVFLTYKEVNECLIQKE